MRRQIRHLFTFFRNTRPYRISYGVKNWRYILDMYRKMNTTGLNKGQSKNGKSIFILNACINPFDNSEFENYGAPTDIEFRFKQVLDSINSVRTFFPEADIAYIENSSIADEFEAILKSRVNIYFNVSSQEMIHFSRRMPIKGLAWSAELMIFLWYNHKKLDYSNFFFLNGRYQVSETTKNVFLNSTKKNHLHVKMKKHNITLIFFYFSGVSVYTMFKIFRFTHLLAVLKYSVEDVFSVFYFKKIYSDYFGVKGLASGVTPYEI